MFIEHLNGKKVRITLDKYYFEDVLVELAMFKQALQRSYLMTPEQSKAIRAMLQDAEDRAKELDMP
jgi:hypothetical protein